MRNSLEVRVEGVRNSLEVGGGCSEQFRGRVKVFGTVWR